MLTALDVMNPVVEDNMSDFRNVLNEWGTMRMERSLYEVSWRDSSYHLDPLLLELFVTDKAATRIGNRTIVDSSPVQAARALIAGLQNGTTPPNRDWFRLTYGNRNQELSTNVKEWLYHETDQTRLAISKSNAYSKFPILYENVTKQAIGALMVEKDYERTIRCTTFTVGSFWVMNNKNGIVDKIVWQTQYTVRQVIEEFCTDSLTGKVDMSHCSKQLQQWAKGSNTHEQKISILMAIFPNKQFDQKRGKMDSAYKKYRRWFFELDRPEGEGIQYLHRDGFDRFPVFVPRWWRREEEHYGSKCPAFECLPDIKELFKKADLKMRGLELEVLPPMVAKGSRSTQNIFGQMPAFLNFSQDGADGYKPAYEIQLNLANLIPDIERTVNIINQCFYADIMRRLAFDERRERATATEINQQYYEDLAQLVVAYHNLETEFLQPFVEEVFAIRVELGMVLSPPPEIAGQEMHVEFISILAQAQKMGNVSSVERFLNEILTVGAQKPEAWDVLNLDRTLKGYGEDLGMDPDEFNADDMIQQIRQQRQQAQQQQAQAAAMAQAANAAKSAAATPMGGDTLLSRITGGGAGPGAPPGSGGGPQGQ